MIFAIGIGLFLLPANILTGGVAGIVALIHPFIDSVSEDILVIIISTVLFIIGVIFLGKEFTVNTIIHSLSYPFILLFVTRALPSVSVDPILAAVYGGVLGGLGVGIMFRQGGSSGGTDIPPLILDKYFGINVSRTIMITDGITVIAGLFIYGLNEVLIGLISVFCTSFMLEKTVKAYGGIEAKKVEIISDKYLEINKEIINDMARGTTIINGKGGYSNEDKKILMAIVSNKELEKIKEIVHRVDTSAFVIIQEVSDVGGEGFTYETRL